MERKILDRQIGPIPPSGLGPDGKLRLESEEERRLRLERARRRLREIAEIPDGPDDPLTFYSWSTDHTSEPIGRSSFPKSLSKITTSCLGFGGEQRIISIPPIFHSRKEPSGRLSKIGSPMRNRSSPTGRIPGTGTSPRPLIEKVSSTMKSRRAMTSAAVSWGVQQVTE
jgi:hypothetical protein